MLPGKLLGECERVELIKYGKHFTGNNLVLYQTIFAGGKSKRQRVFGIEDTFKERQQGTGVVILFIRLESSKCTKEVD